jgi:hypothetical protein
VNRKKIKLSAILLFGIGLSGLYAQEVTAAAGGDASGSGGTASYTVGQVSYITNAGTGGSVAQGVQQAYVVSIVSEIDESNDITLRFSAYPNPVTGILTLRIEGNIHIRYVVSLYDVKGICLENKDTEGIETDIDLSKLVPSTYFLKVTNDNKVLKTFKILKNQ